MLSTYDSKQILDKTRFQANIIRGCFYLVIASFGRHLLARELYDMNQPVPFKGLWPAALMHVNHLVIG